MLFLAATPRLKKMHSHSPSHPPPCRRFDLGAAWPPSPRGPRGTAARAPGQALDGPRPRGPQHSPLARQRHPLRPQAGLAGETTAPGLIFCQRRRRYRRPGRARQQLPLRCQDKRCELERFPLRCRESGAGPREGRRKRLGRSTARSQRHPRDKAEGRSARPRARLRHTQRGVERDRGRPCRPPSGRPATF